MSDTSKNSRNALNYFGRRVLRKLGLVVRSTYQNFIRSRSTKDFSSKLRIDKFYSATFPARPTLPRSLLLDNTGHADDFNYRLTGHAKGHYSLAIVNRALAVALNRHSTNQACFVPFDDGVKKTWQQLSKTLDGDLRATISNSISDSTSKPVISIVHHYPVITDDEPADLRLIIFFWEESTVPQETISLLNEKFDAILVATEFVATVLRNSGCNKPIFVIPMGVDHLVDYDEHLMSLQEIAPGKPFRFLHVSSVFDRKGPEFLLEAFIQQFDADDNVELYIKTFPNPHNRIHQQLAHFSSTKNKPPRVIIDEADVSKETLRDIYRSAHTLVLPTRGEGFNLPAAEGLAMGLPVIVTGFGAHTDFCTTETALLIPFHFDLSQSHLKTSDSCWVTPDANTLSALLKQSVNEVLNESDLLTQRRKAGYALMRSTYTWDKAVQGITNALNWLTANKPANHANAQNLAVKYIRCEALENLVNISLNVTQTDALIFKLNGHQMLSFISDEILNKLCSLKQQVIILLELTDTSELNPDSSNYLSTQSFIKTFDRVIVDTLDDFNKMLSSGEIRNVVFIPRLPDELPTEKIKDHRLRNMIIGLKYDRQQLKN